MFTRSITFLIIALIAAILGFSGIAEMAAGIAKVLFGLFFTLFVISLFFECGHCNRGQTPILWEFNSHRISFCLYTNYYLLSTNFLGYQSISDTYPLNPLHHLHKKHRLFS